MKKSLVLLGMTLLSGISVLTAQGDTCQALLKALATDAQTACSAVKSGQACVGTTASLNTTSADAESVSLLADLTTITTQAVDAQGSTWGIVVARMSAGLTDGDVQAILYGDATLTNEASAAQGEAVSLPIKNIAGYDVNLREGAGTTFKTTGTFPADTEATTDGRSADSQWFRIQINATTNWVNASLVEVSGDVSTLPILDNPYTDPFQAFILTTATAKDEVCGVTASGLLLQYTGDTDAKLSVNGAELAFSDATILLQASADAGLQVQVLAGEATIKADKAEQVVEAGKTVTVALDATSLLANATPDAPTNYAYASVAGAPLEVLAVQDANLCVTGVPLSAESLSTRGGPGDAYSELAPLDNQSHYNVVGYAEDDQASTWFKLDNGRWVLATDNALVGSCNSYAKVDAPPIDTAMSVASSNQSFVPAQNARFQAESGTDVMTGTCSTAPIAVCSHLAVVIPNGDGTISWRGQEPISYPMQNIGLNHFYYSGRNFQNNANLTLDLTFINDNVWTMTMTTVFDSDPTCNHIFYYTGTKL